MKNTKTDQRVVYNATFGKIADTILCEKELVWFHKNSKRGRIKYQQQSLFWNSIKKMFNFIISNIVFVVSTKYLLSKISGFT